MPATPLNDHTDFILDAAAAGYAYAKPENMIAGLWPNRFAVMSDVELLA